jgi:hypothetical protein
MAILKRSVDISTLSFSQKGQDMEEIEEREREMAEIETKITMGVFDTQWNSKKLE